MLMSAESRSAGRGRRAGLNHPRGGEGRASGKKQNRGPTWPSAPLGTRKKERAQLAVADDTRRGSGESCAGGRGGGRETPSRVRVVAAEGGAGGGGGRGSRDGRAAAILSC